MVEEFNGRWIEPIFDNFDEYLKECGISFLLRKLAQKIRDILVIEVVGNKFTHLSLNSFKNHTITWTLGEETLVETIDGRKVYSTFTFENGILIERQRPVKEGDKISLITREIKDNKLIVTFNCNGVIATHIYKKE
ncbi:Cytosolic fatty-acid binding domain and Calycin-like domain and Calycin domain-containing protein [Strongyloides ratti]|uniref:Cytosolic fatty-acid binding domain and Calycin-like domain and Calycin domain-containing protein n=1 Tax=Strongyloides ratti TaxID=34506 RepID=A0A090LI31_STRRB|nr:Cytosolic fatty-acid binding domain and Calycin-like domain and Calycin domain-containing protein [Strongyloides ratti]CEF69471.1 Cytosolic fatty-acid binding domain and Calycin-like domain and Calycin domain-containing protein [Strongyloides ratti]